MCELDNQKPSSFRRGCIMPTFLFYADVDGVLTPNRKLFQCRAVDTKIDWQDTRWYKEYSDRDSFVLQNMKDHVVFISHDKRNTYYVCYKGHKWCYAAHSSGDKYEVLKEDWRQRVDAHEIEGDPHDPRYIFIGDAPFDWLCLKNSMLGFMPFNSSEFLLEKVRREEASHVEHLPVSGGEGCLEAAVGVLHENIEDYSDLNLREMPVFNVLDEYYES